MVLSTGIIVSVIAKLTELLKAEYNLQSGVKEQVKSLTKELECASAFLQDIDKVPLYQLDEQVKIYASEVREASYDMEDVLDTFLVSVQGPERMNNNKKKLFERLLEKMATLLSKTAARHGIAKSIDSIMKRLQEAKERRGRYTVDGFVTRPSPPSVVDPRLAAMHMDVTQLIGTDKSRGKLASLLSLPPQGDEIEMSNNKKLKIVSVVGVGGLGKTTLAKAVYEEFKAEFICWAFVSVGRNPDPKKVFRDILIELNKTYMDPKFATLDETHLIKELRDFLKKKRYFIVIDDVWDTKSWKTINWALVENNTGSRIIITTRNLEVATGEVYNLQPLSHKDSRELLYARIFGGEDKCGYNQRHKVSEVADKILKKCGGVPLAVITMASYLVGKSMGQWLEVCNSIGFCGKDKEQTGDTEWILSLSYYDLPSHLKTCLLYLSIFPEDHFIRKDELIWMWIGEGFIDVKPEIGLFETGEGYFNDLINRSLIQPAEEEHSKIVEGCRVHDMILDLIVSLSRKTNFAIVPDNGEDMRKARRLAFQNGIVDCDTEMDNCTDNIERARSLIAFGCSFGSWVPLQRLKRLHVLHLKDCFIQGFDEHVGNPLHWRFIGMCVKSGLSVTLPKEIGALMFLRVVYLECIDKIVGELLPSSMSMLTQLVCLHAPTMILPSGTIKDLTSLQELQIHRPNRDDNVEQFVKDLANLHELRVLRTDIGWMDESMILEILKSVGNLHKLQRLQLDTSYLIKTPTWDKGLALLPRGLCQLDIPIAGHVLPPCIDPSRLPNLSKLTLEMFSIDEEGLKILGGLPELLYLRLTIFGRHRATLTDTAAHVYFPKLRSCLLHWSAVHFVVNSEAWSVSFYSHSDPHAFDDSIKGKDKGRVAQAVMPNLEALYFNVNVGALTACKNGSCDNLGLQCLASLQKVTVMLNCWGVQFIDVVNKEEHALRHIIQHVHPNRPTLQIDAMYKPLV
ncbi:hypothetical protein U9M48_001273, partial [Paspalum notatum var. saurae]